MSRRHTNYPFFFLSVILVVLCVTLFLLINALNFRICLFFVNSKDFLYEFLWIFSIRWNSWGVIDSKILPFNYSVLFLSLSRITWLICIRSCSNSLPTHCKIILLCSVLILHFSCRSFGRILLWWQQRQNHKWLVSDEYLIIVFSSFRILARMVSPEWVLIYVKIFLLVCSVFIIQKFITINLLCVLTKQSAINENLTLAENEDLTNNEILIYLYQS